MTWRDSLRRAGYSATTARVGIGAFSRRTDIQQRIAELIADSGVLVDAAHLHLLWSEMLHADIADIIEADGTDSAGEYRFKFKPITAWPRIWRQMVTSLDVKELFNSSSSPDGKKSWEKIGQIIKLRFIEQTKLGELLGRHKAVDAFVHTKEEHLHVHAHMDVEQRLLAARAAAARIEGSADNVSVDQQAGDDDNAR
jgi:phage terminase small subunit